MSAQYDAWREEIVGCLAHVEAFIDFGDEEERADDRGEGVVVHLRRAAGRRYYTVDGS